MFRRYDERVHDRDRSRDRGPSTEPQSHTFRAQHAKSLPKRYEERRYPPQYEDRRRKTSR